MLCCHSRQNFVTSCLEVAPYCWLFLMALFGVHIVVYKIAPTLSHRLVSHDADDSECSRGGPAERW
jgi:hypothetical protein